jgi:general secretion pathway protein K
VLLPAPTQVNLNTASKEVLAAATGIGIGDALRLVQHRQRTPFKTLQEAEAQLGPNTKLDPKRVTTMSNFFEVRGRLRLADRALEESSLVERRSALDVITLSRKRESSRESTR